MCQVILTNIFTQPRVWAVHRIQCSLGLYSFKTGCPLQIHMSRIHTTERKQSRYIKEKQVVLNRQWERQSEKTSPSGSTGNPSAACNQRKKSSSQQKLLAFQSWFSMQGRGRGQKLLCWNSENLCTGGTAKHGMLRPSCSAVD